jgi:hypothetical protein
MRNLILLSLLAAACTFLVLGCTGDEAPPAPTPAPAAPQPTPTPAVVDAPDPTEEWLAQSPMRLKMRSMWIDCGMIVRNAAGGGLVDYDSLEGSAEDIARKADGFAVMWEAIRDQNRTMATKAKEGDWFEARYQSQRIWSSCTDCHIENWSQHTRGFRPATIEGWLRNGNTADDVPTANIRLSAPQPFMELMFTMMRGLNRSVRGIENHNPSRVLEASADVHKVANGQLEIWRGIERQARAIAELAANNRTAGIDGHYAKLTQACIDCHTHYVRESRTPLNPLPWKYDE